MGKKKHSSTSTSSSSVTSSSSPSESLTNSEPKLVKKHNKQKAATAPHPASEKAEKRTKEFEDQKPRNLKKSKRRVERLDDSSSSDWSSDSSATYHRGQSIDATRVAPKGQRTSFSDNRPSFAAMGTRTSVDGSRAASVDATAYSTELRHAYKRDRKVEKARLKGNLKGKKDPTTDNVAAVYEEHTFDNKTLVKRLNTRINDEDPANSKGLTEEEAAAYCNENGFNELSARKGTPMWLKFLKQFTAFFPLLLEGAGIACLIAWGLEGGPNAPTHDNLYLGIILIVVVIATAIFAFLQEAKADKASSGFKSMQADNTVVRRNGKKGTVPARILAVGDIVVLKAGDKVPADCVVIAAQDFKVDNSSLTGEPEPQKRLPGASHELFLETHNLVFFGTLVQEGSGTCVVVRTGDRTYMGHIANTVAQAKPEPSPLRREVSRFIKIITVVAICLGFTFFFVGLFIGDLALLVTIVFVIGIIVANVPEGLLPTLTLGLTLTAKRLAAKNVLAKNLEAVETLGACSTICSDKTGTLTQNVMTCVHVWYNLAIRNTEAVLENDTYDPNDKTFEELFIIAALCNNASFNPDEENMSLPIQKRTATGDASEIALLKMASRVTDVEAFREKYPKKFEIPFNSDNKWQLSIHTDEERKRNVLVFKGAPERVLGKCTNILLDGTPVPLDETHEKEFQKAYEQLAGNGERVLALAELSMPWSEYDPNAYYDKDSHNYPIEGFTFVGLVALQDPPKHGVREAVSECGRAGIRIVMVTGDHALTAQAIAREIGIIRGPTLNNIAKEQGKESWKDVDPESAEAVVVTGHEIPSFTDDEWNNVLSKRQIVFARTSPEQKLEIVSHCQARGEIVAATGDGVNDSPALRKADLGCAMGIMGTEVSKESAVVILMDDNFASIVVGVREGRLIFDNLKKAIAYLLSSNGAELIPFVLFGVIGLPLALSAILILCIDLGTDVVPAISFAYEEPEDNLMDRPPRNPKKDRLVTGKLAIYSYVWLGFWQCLAGFLAFLVVFWNAGIATNELTYTAHHYWKNPTDDWLCFDNGAPRDGINSAQDCLAYQQQEGTDLDGSKWVFPFCVHWSERGRCIENYKDYCDFIPIDELDFLTTDKLQEQGISPCQVTGLPAVPDQFGAAEELTCQGTKVPKSLDTEAGADYLGTRNGVQGCYGFRSYRYRDDDRPQTHVLRKAQSSFFIGVMIVRLCCLLVCKTRFNSLYRQGMKNKVLIFGLLSSLLLGIAITSVPGVTTVFGTVPPSWEPWIIGAFFFGLLLCLEEFRKHLLRHKRCTWASY